MIRCQTCSCENSDISARCRQCGAALVNPFQAPQHEVVTATAVGGGDDAVATVIPYRNANALIAYYLGLFSCFPVLGFPLAIIALWLGVRGLKAVRIDPSAHGTAHAWVGLICGTIGFLMNLMIISVLVLGAVASATR